MLDVHLNIKHVYKHIVKVCDVVHEDFNWIGMVHEDMIKTELQ